MNRLSHHVELPCLAASVAVGTLLVGLLAGFEPSGGDPDTLYRPLKSELARAIKDGTLPFWSDRIGLGVPLLAESQVAAFYPPNLLLYSVLAVPHCLPPLDVAPLRGARRHDLSLCTKARAHARGKAPSRPSPSPSAGSRQSTLCHEPFYHA